MRREFKVKTKMVVPLIKMYKKFGYEVCIIERGVMIMIKGIVFIILSRICFIDYCILRGNKK